MKNLLVDALRQAKAEQADSESDDAVRLGETPIEGASNDGDEFVEQDYDETLELMQTTSNLVVVDVEVDVEDAPDSADGSGPDADAAFEEAFELAGAGQGRDGAKSDQPRPVCHSRPDGFIEHSARWLPLACLLLLAAAVGTVPVWKGMMSDEGDLGLLVEGSALPIESSYLNGTGEGESGSSRFPYASTTSAPVTTPRVAPPVPVDPPPQQQEPVEIVVQVRERSPTGATDLRDDTFSTISGLYQAYLAGEVSRSGLVDILDTRVSQQQPGTESEIKLLLQQYPKESILHNALGTLLAGQSRWPEARTAFARAAETAEGTR